MDEQKILQELMIFGEGIDWIDEHYDELKLIYPDEFVAVFKGKLVAHHQDMKNLMGKLEKKYPEDAGNIAVKFVTPEDPMLIL